MSGLLARAPLAALRSRYDEPWRSYHDWAHPQAMLRHLERAMAAHVSVADHDAAVGFILWHDAIYDPQASGGRNERLSAALCRTEMAPLAGVQSVERAMRAIEATISHRLPEGDCPDAALLLDIDLSILGSDIDRFDAYDEAIRREYAHVAQPAYMVGRRAVLSTFMTRDRLFLTDWGHQQWEASARTNLRRAIERLG